MDLEPSGTHDKVVSRSFYQGAAAEYIVCNQGLLIEKPTHLSWVEAASIPENYITGAHGDSMPG